MGTLKDNIRILRDHFPPPSGQPMAEIRSGTGHLLHPPTAVRQRVYLNRSNPSTRSDLLPRLVLFLTTGYQYQQISSPPHFQSLTDSLRRLACNGNSIIGNAGLL